MPAVRADVTAAEMILACGAAADQGARLVALWGSDDRDRGRGLRASVVLIDADGLTLLEHRLPGTNAHYPDLARIFPAANRMQRAAFDLVGIASDADDQRRWLRHASWPADAFPLQRDFVAPANGAVADDPYPFVRVEGDGVHEIPVGPVHAGIIEPGHFRFQVVGEKVLRLEERLGYVHKGIEKRFESMSIADGARLAGRVSGDSTVAYAWAYAQAAEALAGVTVPPRAAWLRALALERERIANHLGDLGYLGNDGGFAFGLAQFSRLKEDVLRTNLAAFGHRMAMDYIVPGGVARDLEATQCGVDCRDECDVLDARGRDAARHLRRACRPAGSIPQLRLRHTRACRTTRPHRPGRPCERPGVRPALRFPDRAVHRDRRAHGNADDGDVAARVAVRFDELVESLRLVRAIVDGPAGVRPHWRRPVAVPRGAAVSPWPRASSKAGAGRCSLRSKAAPRGRSAAAIRTIRRGRTGRCSSTRSSATSFPTSR